MTTTGQQPARTPRSGRSIELTVLFFAGPVIYGIWISGPGLLFPALWLAAIACFAALYTARGFNRRELWNVAGLARVWKPMLLRFLILGGIIAAAVAAYDRLLNDGPPILLSLPRSRPQLWAIIMIAYPVLSVYPQELIWRTFFVHRYERMLNPRWTIILSAASFGLVHILFGNWIAVGMTAIGGLLFAHTYARSRSTLAAVLEHALYGCLVFTIGLGRYFYSGNAG